jgi:hypothetical protein
LCVCTHPYCGAKSETFAQPARLFCTLRRAGDIPQEVTIEDKALIEQVKLIQELEPDEKNMVFKMVDTFLTQKKFKDFFAKNVAAL